MKLSNIIAVPILTVATFLPVEGKFKGNNNIAASGEERLVADARAGFSVKNSSIVKNFGSRAALPISIHGLAHKVNLAKRVTAADVEELDHYTSEALIGLDMLVEHILDADFDAAEDEYNDIAPLFQQMMRYAAPPKSFCVINGPGQYITLAQAVDVVRDIQVSLQAMLLAAPSQDEGRILAGLCDGQALFFNSGLHEVIFQRGQVSGTGS